ncbi:MAG: PAS domain S-box protein [Cyclobacteriaceae bacterium]|nr:PAS domain S-box protein [Cyclobacteriaceae bacterium]
MSRWDENQITVISRLGIIMLIAAFLFMIGLYISGVNIWYRVVFAPILYGSALYASHKKKHLLARNLLLYGSLVLFTFLCFLNRRTGSEYFLFGVACSSPMIFKGSRAMYVTFLLVGIVLLTYVVYDAVTPFTPNPTINYPVLSTLCLITMGSVLFYQIILYRNLISHYSQSLKDKNKQLDKTLDSKQVVEGELQSKNRELKTLTEQLNWIVRQKDSELQAYLDAINVNIYSSINDLSGRFVKVNDPLLRATGYTSDELIGKSFRLLDSGHHPESFYQKMETSIKAGNTWRGEIKNRAKDGTFFWCDQVIIPIRGEEDKVSYFLILALSITERKNTEEAREKTLKVLETIAYQTSHKVRGPLARIQGLVSLVQRDLVVGDELKMITEKLDICAVELNSATSDLVNFVNDHQHRYTKGGEDEPAPAAPPLA